ncbi:alcohol dehydrogenase catalytic domain-containing protein [Novosphingobium guangzhouense]|uniref:Quinone oxidoreductase n=1 Tax=Novosphingobium guangzhouense TaxID=1850347 RepID=A0A2K2FYC8_9SPHN|nr:zinc-binding dehydrogenase [Novosphingobium guangzhouense]PNU03762.1 quinone oxidoreductase [Novosphingobium guangzhouense]
MARKIEIRTIGTPAVLRVMETEVGLPGAGQVRLVQTAIGINYVDVMVRKGLYPMRLPATPGFEAAGVVDAVGPGVTGFAPGDRVAYFFVEGAYATASLVPAEALVRLPDDISNEVAATFLAKGLTAWMGLYALHPLKAGEVALVLGASGSVGAILSRWARSLGATVIGVAGSVGKLASVAAGADHAFVADDPALSDRVRAIVPAGVDVVYDFVGQATFPLAVAGVRDGGVIATIGAASGQALPAADQLRSRAVQLRGGGTPQYVRGETVAVATSQLWAAIGAGLFSDLQVARYTFDRIAAAHEDIEARQLTGLPVAMV